MQNIKFFSITKRRFFSSLNNNNIQYDLLKKDNIPLYKRFISNISYALINLYNNITFISANNSYKRFFTNINKALINLTNTAILKQNTNITNLNKNNLISYNNFILSICNSFNKINNQLTDTKTNNIFLYKSFTISVQNAFNKLHQITKAVKPTKAKVVKQTKAVKPTKAKVVKQTKTVKPTKAPKLSKKEATLLQNLIKKNDLLIKNIEKTKK